ncbi:MAG: hypothetical protein JNM29_12620 [Candidatus Odyssella sp.]|nr:hypothetical protein [Candidatus Odyssella sp.]
MNVLKIKAAFVCEDVRHEQSGKAIYIGVYSALIYSSAFPVSLALHFVLMNEIPAPGEYSAKLRVRDEDVDAKPVELTLSANAAAPILTELASFGPILIHAKKPQQFWLEQEVEGKWETIGAWNVIPTKLPPPPSG